MIALTAILFLVLSSSASAQRGRATVAGGSVHSDQGTLLRGPYIKLVNNTIYTVGSSASYLYTAAYWQPYKDVGFNNVRICVAWGASNYPGFSSSVTMQALDQLVAVFTSLNMYVTICGSAGDYAPYNPTDLQDEWNNLAPRYAGNTNVNYEIQNEPYGDPNGFVNSSAPYGQAGQLVSIYQSVRSMAPHSLIAMWDFSCLGDNYDSALWAIEANDPSGTISYANTAVSFHYYSPTQPSYVAALQADYPVWMTEGSDDATGAALDSDFPWYLDCETKGISWNTFDFISTLQHAMDIKAYLVANGHSWLKDTDSMGSPTVAAVSGCSFETPALAAGSYQYNPTGMSWTFSSSAGVQSNGSGMSASNAPDGNQTAFLQGVSGTNGSISQTLYFPSAGTFMVAFQSAARTGYGGRQSFNVEIDGAVVGSFSPTSGSFTAYTSNPFTITTTGNHTLTFVGTSTTGDDTDFIDYVTIAETTGVNQVLLSDTFNRTGHLVGSTNDNGLGGTATATWTGYSDGITDTTTASAPSFNTTTGYASVGGNGSYHNIDEIPVNITSGHIYTLTAVVSITASNSNSILLGFDNGYAESWGTFGEFDLNATGPSIACFAPYSSGDVQAYMGTTNNGWTSATSTPVGPATANPLTNETISIRLDTTGTNWVAYYSLNGVQFATKTYSGSIASYVTNIELGSQSQAGVFQSLTLTSMNAGPTTVLSDTFNRSGHLVGSVNDNGLGGSTTATWTGYNDGIIDTTTAAAPSFNSTIGYASVGGNGSYHNIDEIPVSITSGHVYTLTAVVSITASNSNWIVLGFDNGYAESWGTFGEYALNATGPSIVSYAPYSSGDVQAYMGTTNNGWTSTTGTPVGPATANPLTNETISIKLDTTGANWVASYSLNGVQFATKTYSGSLGSYVTNIELGSQSQAGVFQKLTLTSQ